MIGDDVESPALADFVRSLNARIHATRMSASQTVHREEVLLYWDLGSLLLDYQSEWNEEALEGVAEQLQQAFPSLSGLSAKNLRYMIRFAEAYREIEAGSLSDLPWEGNKLLLDHVKSHDDRMWLAKRAVYSRWTQRVLASNVETLLYRTKRKRNTWRSRW